MEESSMTQMYRTLRVARIDEGVLSVVIDAPPMNLIGPELARDLVTLLSELKSDEDMRVMVLESDDPEYFVPHVDLTRVAEYTAEAAKAGGPDDASLGMLWHKLSELPIVTIAKLRGRARGAGSELDAFVARLARRIASFPADAVRSTKQVLNELTLPGANAMRADARPFQQLVRSDTVKARLATLFAQGLQTRGQLELDLGDRLESL
jgi:enoyl-CoA hydratase/carnithine racemase